MAKAPILDLDTLFDRPTVRIDGKLYELWSPDELSVFDSQYFTRAGREIEELAKGDDVEGLAALIGKVCRRCLVEIPDEVFGKLSPPQKTAIVEAFSGLLLRRRLSVAGAIAAAVVESRKPEMSSTGAISSQGSSDSSAAIPTGGFAAPPLHS